MKRRRLLGVIGTGLLPLAGCLGRFAESDDDSATAGTCEESTPPNVRAVTEKTTTEPTGTPTDEELHWTLDYDLRARSANPAGSGTNPVVTVTITELVEGDCNPVAFARRYELEPKAAITVEDPISEADDGTYRIDARLANGNAASREIYVHEDGILDYAGYTVSVHSGTVEISKIQV